MLDYSIDTSFTTIQGIDNPYPDELAPERIEVSMGLKIYRTPHNDPSSTYFAPGGDQAAPTGTSITGPQGDFLSSPYITVEVRDKLSDRTILFLPRAVITKRSGSVESEGLLTESWSIRSIGFGGAGSQADASFFGAKLPKELSLRGLGINV